MVTLTGDPLRFSLNAPAVKQSIACPASLCASRQKTQAVSRLTKTVRKSSASATSWLSLSPYDWGKGLKWGLRSLIMKEGVGWLEEFLKIERETWFFVKKRSSGVSPGSPNQELTSQETLGVLVIVATSATGVVATSRATRVTTSVATGRGTTTCRSTTAVITTAIGIRGIRGIR